MNYSLMGLQIYAKIRICKKIYRNLTGNLMIISSKKSEQLRVNLVDYH